MIKKLVRQGRVEGYRPSLTQLNELLQLAQRDISDNAMASILYRQGGSEYYLPEGICRIEPNQLDQLLNVAPVTGELTNLDFCIAQDHPPMRGVSINIGPGDWTFYSVESSDPTWALGRYHELSEKLLQDRGSYAKFKAPSPEVLKEGTHSKWESAPWKQVKDWRVTLSGIAVVLPYYTFFVCLAFLGLTELNTLGPGGKTAADKQTYAQALQMTRWVDAHHVGLIEFFLAYGIGLLLLRRWVKTLRESRILLQEHSLWSNFMLSRNRTNPIALVSLYAAIAMVVLGLVGLIVA